MCFHFSWSIYEQTGHVKLFEELLECFQVTAHFTFSQLQGMTVPISPDPHQHITVYFYDYSHAHIYEVAPCCVFCFLEIYLLN